LFFVFFIFLLPVVVNKDVHMFCTALLYSTELPARITYS